MDSKRLVSNINIRL